MARAACCMDLLCQRTLLFACSCLTLPAAGHHGLPSGTTAAASHCMTPHPVLQMRTPSLPGRLESTCASPGACWVQGFYRHAAFCTVRLARGSPFCSVHANAAWPTHHLATTSETQQAPSAIRVLPAVSQPCRQRQVQAQCSVRVCLSSFSFFQDGCIPGCFDRSMAHAEAPAWCLRLPQPKHN